MITTILCFWPLAPHVVFVLIEFTPKAEAVAIHTCIAAPSTVPVWKRDVVRLLMDLSGCLRFGLMTIDGNGCSLNHRTLDTRQVKAA